MDKKKILFINPPSRDKSINRDMAGGLGYSAGEGVVLPPMDLLNMAATLRMKGYHVEFIDAIAERIDDVERIIEILRREKYGVLVGSLALPTIDEDIDFYKRLKGKLGQQLRIIIKTGINYKEIINRVVKESGIREIINWESDLGIEDYLAGKKSESGVVKDLDKLPMAARDLVKISLYKYILLPGKVTTMQSSRGCPYPCGFYCPYPLVQGKLWRAMSPKRVIKEMTDVKRLGYDSVLFRDATFTLDMNRAKKIADLLVKKKINLKWWCETRINVIDEDLLVKFKKAGCQGINVGVETLDEVLIKTEGKPGVRLADVIRIRKLAKKIGIKLHFLLIVGLPNDNVAALYQTFKYLKDLMPESAGISVITPYPGTEMFDQAMKEGLIESYNWNEFKGSISNMRTKYLSRHEIQFGRFLLGSSVYVNRKEGIIKRMGLVFIDLIFKLWQIGKRI